MDKIAIKEKLKKMIGSKVTMYVDRPLGSAHPKHKDIVYKVNYGYIKEIIALDGDYQDAYLLGVDKSVESYEGIVYAIVERENEIRAFQPKEYWSLDVTLDRVGKAGSFEGMCSGAGIAQLAKIKATELLLKIIGEMPKDEMEITQKGINIVAADARLKQAFEDL